MCVVSAVSEPFKYPNSWPNWPTAVPFPSSPFKPMEIEKSFEQKVTREEFEALRAQVEDLKILLEKAKDQDIREGNPDCEMEDKVFVIKKIAELVGVDLGDVFPK
jgi:hypothetical protein